MKKFLEATEFCDKDHPDIQNIAKTLKKDRDKETAIEVWNFTTGIPYRFDFWSTKASETLGKGYGMCTNKANLQIALLRALDVPAAYGIMKIKKEALLDVSTPEFYEKVSPITTHVFCYVYLNGQWVASDATRDQEKYKDEEPEEIFDIRSMPWDGETNYKKPSVYVVSERPMQANIDEKLKVKPRFLTPEILKSINSHIDSLVLKEG